MSQLADAVALKLPREAVLAINWLTEDERRHPLWVRCAPRETFIAVGYTMKKMVVATVLPSCLSPYMLRVIIVSGANASDRFYNSVMAQLTSMVSAGVSVIVVDASGAPDGWLEITA